MAKSHPFYLVILDGDQIDDIIYNPSKIKKYIENYEREAEESKRRTKKSS